MSKKLISIVFILFSISSCNWFEFNHVDISDIENYPNANIQFNKDLKTVVFLVDEEGTEITDLLIPYHILSIPKKLNLFILSQNAKPVSVWKGLYLIPHGSVEKFDISPDIIVIPANFHPSDPKLIQYIKKNADKKFLSICEGARLIGESGIFSEYTMTSHASAISEFEKKYPTIHWKSNVKYTIDRNLISSAGVASSTEGSLVLIRELFGKEEMWKVQAKIHYPYSEVKQDYTSNPIGLSIGYEIAKKVLFGESPTIGMEIYEGMNEFLLASYLDTFNRTFPKRIESFGPSPIVSMYGLILYPTQKLKGYDYGFCKEDCSEYKLEIKNKIEQENNVYFFDTTMRLVDKFYGENLKTATKSLLDY
ncbi:MAG: DJ-1/PfpI family protein [Leptospiraceae bacterium]|nr:DJ-1/PfpI family protein [Leptospiraceae bacterium]